MTISNATSCIGCTNGAINVYNTGGVIPYSWSISPQSGIFTDTSFEQLAAGIYTICVSDAQGCSLCVVDTVHEDPTAMPVVNSDLVDVFIYPNPTSKWSILKCVGLPRGYSFEIVIRDLSGRLISREKFDPRELYNLPHDLSAGI